MPFGRVGFCRVRFDASDEAIRCSVAIREAVPALGLETGAGLYAGEYKLIGNELEWRLYAVEP